MRSFISEISAHNKLEKFFVEPTTLPSTDLKNLGQTELKKLSVNSAIFTSKVQKYLPQKKVRSSFLAKRRTNSAHNNDQSVTCNEKFEEMLMNSGLCVGISVLWKIDQLKKTKLSLVRTFFLFFS